MRIMLLSFLLVVGACKDHKRPNSVDAKPLEAKPTPYNGVPEGEQKK